KCLMKTQTEEKKDRRIILIWGAIWKEYIYAALKQGNETKKDCIKRLESDGRLVILNKNNSYNRSLKNCGNTEFIESFKKICYQNKS
ncbi:MAG: hypothetical protein K2K48_07185, partial [Anaeroplasmataceae bacterium]|nr:hypothetical protein [Anaeroplasmataceae bacterium]